MIGSNIFITNRAGVGTTDSLVPVNTVAPVISGTQLVGSTLSTTNGTWTSDTGVTGFSYQWRRNGVVISGATNNTYVLVNADLDANITCAVAATDLDGTSAFVSSNALYIFDADYQAVVDRALVLGFNVPTLTQRIQQNKLVLSMKSSGVWAKLDVFYVYANNGGQNFATLNWKNPNAHQSTLVNAPAFTSNVGFTGDGVASHINTNFNPATSGVQYQLNNASRYAYLLNSVSGATNFIDGTISDVNCIARSNVAYQRINQGNLNLNSIFNFTSSIGMKSIHRISSTNVELFNETTQESRTVTSTSISSSNQLILRNASFYGTSQVSMYAMGASLVAENTAFVNAFNTYMTSL